MREHLAEVAQSPKVGTAVAAGTSTSGLGTFLDLIPNDIGKLATLVGIVLSMVLIYANILAIKERKLNIALAVDRRLQSEKPESDQQP